MTDHQSKHNELKKKIAEIAKISANDVFTSEEYQRRQDIIARRNLSICPPSHNSSLSSHHHSQKFQNVSPVLTDNIFKENKDLCGVHSSYSYQDNAPKDSSYNLKIFSNNHDRIQVGQSQRKAFKDKMDQSQKLQGQKNSQAVTVKSLKLGKLADFGSSKKSPFFDQAIQKKFITFQNNEKDLSVPLFQASGLQTNGIYSFIQKSQYESKKPNFAQGDRKKQIQGSSDIFYLRKPDYSPDCDFKSNKNKTQLFHIPRSQDQGNITERIIKSKTVDNDRGLGSSKNQKQILSQPVNPEHKGQRDEDKQIKAYNPSLQRKNNFTNRSASFESFSYKPLVEEKILDKAERGNPPINQHSNTQIKGSIQISTKDNLSYRPDTEPSFSLIPEITLMMNVKTQNSSQRYENEPLINSKITKVFDYQQQKVFSRKKNEIQDNQPPKKTDLFNSGPDNIKNINTSPYSQPERCFGRGNPISSKLSSNSQAYQTNQFSSNSQSNNIFNASSYIDNIFNRQSNEPSNLAIEKQYVATAFTSGENIFANCKLQPPNTASSILYNNESNNLFKKQNAVQDKKDEQQQIEAQGNSNPNLSSRRCKYVKTYQLFKETAVKFCQQMKDLLEGVIISLQKFEENSAIYLYVRMDNRRFAFCGQMLPGVTEVERLNSSKKVQLKQIMSNPQEWGRPALTNVEIQFKDEQTRQILIKMVGSIAKNQPL